MSCLIDWARYWKVVFVQDLRKIQWLGNEEVKYVLAFMNAHSFWAASLDMYIHEADFRFPR